MSATAGGGSTQTDGPAGPAARLGLQAGMVVQELGLGQRHRRRPPGRDRGRASTPTWSTATTATSWTPSLLWWRDEDGDLVDGLVDSLTDLVGGGAIWLLTPKVGRPNAVDPADIAEAAPIAGLSPDHDRGGQQGLVGHPAGHPQDARLTRHADRPHGITRAPTVLGRAAAAGTSLKVLDRGRASPALLARWPWPGSGKALKDWGTGPAGGFTRAGGARPATSVGLIDELGLADLRRAAPALQRAGPRRWPSAGVGEGDGVAVMCRNHRGFVDACVAIAKLGADILYLNTAFAGPQLVDVLEREKPTAVIHDEEFTGLLAERRRSAHRGRSPGPTARPTTGRRSTAPRSPAYPDADLDPPERHVRIVILTSGTTGTPKGAPRSEAGIDAAVSLLSRMPLRHGWRTHIAAPLFHTWGFAHLALAMLLGSTVVLRRRFDPEELPARSPRTSAATRWSVIPVMLQRILALPEEMLDRLRPAHAQGGRRPPAPRCPATWP